MKVKEFLKPNLFKLLVFLFIGVIYIYFAREETCAFGGFLFSFCYRTYGFPFFYLATGDVDISTEYIKTLFLGEHFNKYGNVMFNVVALLADITLIYILSCFISVLFKNMQLESK